MSDEAGHAAVLSPRAAVRAVEAEATVVAVRRDLDERYQTIQRWIREAEMIESTVDARQDTRAWVEVARREAADMLARARAEMLAELATAQGEAKRRVDQAKHTAAVLRADIERAFGTSQPVAAGVPVESRAIDPGGNPSHLEESKLGSLVLDPTDAEVFDRFWKGLDDQDPASRSRRFAWPRP